MADRLAVGLETHAVLTGETGRSKVIEVSEYDVGDEFDQLTRQYSRTVAMSATLSQLAKGRLGLPALVTTDESFEAPANPLASCVPRDPEASEASLWSESVLHWLVASSRGAALVVANSHTEKERTADALRTAGWRVGMQSAGSEEVEVLVAEMVAGEIDVLVDTESMGTGIDIPSDALRLVVPLSPFPPKLFNDSFPSMWSRRVGYQRRWPALLSKMAHEKVRGAIGRPLRRIPTGSGGLHRAPARPPDALELGHPLDGDLRPR